MAIKIYTIADIQNMYFDLDADYELANDIDASETETSNWGLGFYPVGFGYLSTGTRTGYPVETTYILGTWVGDPETLWLHKNFWRTVGSITGSNGSEIRFIASNREIEYTIDRTVALASVSIPSRARSTGGSSRFRAFMKVYGTYYYGSSHTFSSTSFNYYNTTWTTNPATGNPWTHDDLITGIQEIGIQVTLGQVEFQTFGVRGSYSGGMGESPAFSGTLDGKGYTIYNLYVRRPMIHCGGLFQSMEEGALVKNLNFDGLHVESDEDSGGLAYYVCDSIIDNCHIINGDIFTWDYSGGFCAFLDVYSAETKVINSSFSGRIEGRAVGGIAVYAWDSKIQDTWANCQIFSISVGAGLICYASDCLIEDCYASVIISTESDGGGLLGNIERCTVNRCYSTGIVSGDDRGYWGIFSPYLGGFAIGLSDCTVLDCYATVDCLAGEDIYAAYLAGFAGDITGTSEISRCFAKGTLQADADKGYAGGFAQYVTAKIFDCYAIVDVSCGPLLLHRAGGFAADIWYATADVQRCYCVGKLTGGVLLGGFVAETYLSNVENCFWDIEASGQHTSDGGKGEFTEQMKDIYTFLGASWDISEVNDELNDGYPFLRWQLS